jgi:ABC-type branched-subunit amino acid transport system substrate-binding protein
VGLGSVCTDDNLCSSVASQNARCTKTSPRDLFLNAEKYGDRIIIGTLFDDSQAKHLFRENSVILAAGELNGTDAKLAGRQVGLVHCTPSANEQQDNLSRAEGAAVAARYLVDVLGVPAIIGPADSTSAKEVFEELKGSGTLIMSPSATSTDLSGKGFDPDDLLWRTAPPDDKQAEAMARYLSRTPVGDSDTGSGDVFVVYADDAYGKPLFDNLKASPYLPPGKLLGSESYSPANVRSLAPAIEVASDSDAKTVAFFANQEDVKGFLGEAVLDTAYFDGEENTTNKLIFLPDSAASRDVIDGVAGLDVLFPNIRGTRPELERSTLYTNFSLAYFRRFKESPDGRSYASNSYDAAWLVFAGMAWSQGMHGEISGAGIAEGLKHVSPDMPEEDEIPLEPDNWQDIVDSLTAGNSIDVVGASGSLDYDSEEYELNDHPYEIWKYEAGTVKPDPIGTAYLKPDETP